MIRKSKITLPRTYLIKCFNGELDFLLERITKKPQKNMKQITHDIDFIFNCKRNSFISRFANLVCYKN